MNDRMNDKSNRRRLLTLAALVASPLALVACSADGPEHAGDISAIRSNPSPAMHTLAERYPDRLNTHAYTKDTNFRALNTDIDRIFNFDRPSRLRPGIKP